MNNTTSAPPTEPSPTNEPWENWLAGILFILTAVVPMILYVPCLYIFRTDKEMSKKACYKFMFNLGISDMFQLLLLGTTGGFWCITGVPSRWLDSICGAIGNGCWFANNSFAHLLAFNRFVLVVLPQYEPKIFSVTKDRIFIFFGWLWAFYFFTVFVIPGCGLEFLADVWVWNYKAGYEKNYYCYVTGELDKYQNWTQVSLMGFWYACLIIRLATLPQMGNNASSKKEIRVLIQSFLIWIALVILNLYWWVILPIVIDSKWALLFIQILWNLNSGMNPVIYLTFNTQLRKKYLALVGIKGASVGPESTVQTTTVATSRVKAAIRNNNLVKEQPEA